jgi:hypothetical protein
VYFRRQNSRVKALSNGNITGDIFVSTKPGAAAAFVACFRPDAGKKVIKEV